VISALAIDSGRITTHTETLLGRISPCGKRLETFTLKHYWGTSALDDGFKTLGFEVVAGICGGLRAGVGAELHAEKRRSGRKK
jgi:hypothetical protein